MVDVRAKDKIEGSASSSASVLEPQEAVADGGNGQLQRTGQKELPPGMTRRHACASPPTDTATISGGTPCSPARS